MSQLMVTSMWRAQNLFKSDFLSLMVNGWNMSTPRCVNGGTLRHPTLRKSAIFFTPNLPRSLRQLTYLYIISLTTMLALSIQNSFCLKIFKVIPLPPWATFSWHHRMIASNMLLYFGETKGWPSKGWISPICYQLVTNHYYPRKSHSAVWVWT